MESWISKLNIVLSKTVLVQPYSKRVKILRQQLGLIDSEVAVQTAHNQIQKRLHQLKNLLDTKRKLLTEHQIELEKVDA
jgi:hypothetical protein